MGSQWLEDGQRGPPPRLPNTTVSGSPGSHSALEAGGPFCHWPQTWAPGVRCRGISWTLPRLEGRDSPPQHLRAGMMRMRPEAVAGRWAEPQGPRIAQEQTGGPQGPTFTARALCSGHLGPTRMQLGSRVQPTSCIRLSERRRLEGRESQTHTPWATGSREVGPAAPAGVEDSGVSIVLRCCFFINTLLEVAGQLWSLTGQAG